MDPSFHSHLEQNGLGAILGSWTAGTGPLYRRLADAVRGAVERGDLPAGARLPAERALAQQLRISRSTAVAAYERLQDEQLIERRQGSGTRVLEQPHGRARRPARPSITRELGRNSLFRGIIGLPNATIDLAGAWLLPAAMPSAALEGIAEDIDALGHASGYGPLGYPPLRQAIAEHFTARGVATNPEQVLVAAGAQQAIHLVACLQLDRGDSVLVENPTYPGALDAFNTTGARLIGVPTRRNGIDLDQLSDLAQQLSPALAYVIPTYQNPVGSLLVASRRRMLASLVDQYEMPLLEDDSLAGLGLTEESPTPVAAYASSAKTPIFTVGSLSKLCWGGLRVGWVRAPEPLIAQLGRLKAVFDLGTSLPSQLIAARVMRELDSISRARRPVVAERLQLISTLLEELLPEWTWDRPSGGLCLWVRLPHGNAPELAQVALRHGVSIVPGTVASVDGSFSDYLRLPFGHEPTVLEEAVRRLARAWRAYAPTTRVRAEKVAVVV